MTTKMDFNQALEQVNGFGLYQILLIAFMVIPSAVLTSFLYLVQFFLLIVPEDHWCHVPMPEGMENISLSEWKNLTIPRYKNGDFKQCVMYDGNWTYSNTSETPDEIPCADGWDYDFTSLYPTVATEGNWVCKKEGYPYLSQVIYYIGTSIGVLVFGFAADKFGRKPCIMISYLLASAAGTGSAFASSFGLFSTLRFVCGACIITLSEDPYVLSMEYIAVKRRTLLIVFWSLGYIIFSAICPWLSYAIKDWSTLTLVVSVPLAFVCLGSRFVPESASWLITQGKPEKAVEYLRRVAKVNKTSLPENLVIMQDPDPAMVEEETSEVSFFSLFKTPRLRRRTLLLALTNFLSYTCYHTNTQNTSNFGYDHYVSFTLGSVVEFPNLIIVMVGIERWGRRWPRFLALITAAVAGLIMPAVPEDKHYTILAVGLIQRLAFAVNTNIVMLYSAELLPTVLRGRGLAFLRFTGTLGLLVAPAFVFLATADHRSPLLACGGLALALAAVALMMPETLNQPLAHSVEEGEHFGEDQKLWDFSFCGKPDNQVT